MSRPDPHCVTCNGSGLEEFTSGEVRTSGNSYSGSQTITASERHPVYRQCSCTRRAAEPVHVPAEASRRYGTD